MRKLIICLALAFPVSAHQAPISPYKWYDRAELRCLADNIYHEARGEESYGQMLVARVTLNRAEKMNESICKTVYKPKQFSWTLKKQKPIDRSSLAYQQAVHYAHQAQHLPNYDLYYFHTKQVKPFWSRKVPLQFAYGNHVFYAQNSPAV